MRISHIEARQILDSRGMPTVEADVWIDDKIFGRAAVPSGASTGEHEAIELRDNESAYGGKAVTQAVNNINTVIAGSLRGSEPDNQKDIDSSLIELDGTDNKSKLGANAILAVSLACAHATAKVMKLPLYSYINDLAGRPPMALPMPMMNFLNGGKHATKSSDFQEFMIIPKAAGSFAEAVQIGAEIFQALKQLLAKANLPTSVGDEGGFTYPISANTDMLELLNEAALAAGYQPGESVVYAIDAAASELFDNGVYHLGSEQRQLSSGELLDYYKLITSRYPVASIEDGYAEDEWQDWQRLTKELGNIQLVGDDLLVTNRDRLQKAIDLGAGNAILIKPNQIGTLSETLETILLAQKHDWRTIISHRSGETEDTTIAHLAVGIGAGQIKTGSLSRGERTAKYNELLRIEASDKLLQLDNPFGGE